MDGPFVEHIADRLAQMELLTAFKGVRQARVPGEPVSFSAAPIELRSGWGRAIAQDGRVGTLRGVRSQAANRDEAFVVFARDAGPRLRRALVATYGAVEGRSAAVDALSWAWMHWDRLEVMANPVGYLYRVGQTAARRNRSRPPRADAGRGFDDAPNAPDEELMAALAALPDKQRTMVVLVHGYGWTVREVAEVMELSASTVQYHVTRALGWVRSQLEVSDARRSN